MPSEKTKIANVVQLAVEAYRKDDVVVIWSTEGSLLHGREWDSSNPPDFLPKDRLTNKIIIRDVDRSDFENSNAWDVIEEAKRDFLRRHGK